MDTSGLGPLDVVQIVLVVLKVAKVIDWSWWVVLIPCWIGLGAICVIAIALFADYHRNKI